MKLYHLFFFLLGKLQTLSEEDNAFYKSFTKIDLLKLSHQLHSYELRGHRRFVEGIKQ